MTASARPLAPTQQAGGDFVMRGPAGEVVMPNLLRLREVSDYTATPELAPVAPISGAKACDRRDQHDSLDTEVDDAALFADDDAGRRKQQRCARSESRSDQCCNFIHGMTRTGLRHTGRYMMSVSQASRKKRSSPWKTPVSADGRPRRDWASSPPM